MELKKSDLVHESSISAATAAATMAATAAATALVANDISWIKQNLAEIKGTLEKIEARYVTKDEFSPFVKIVYGLITGVIALTGGLVILILKK